MKYLFAFVVIKTAISSCCMECLTIDALSNSCSDCNPGFYHFSKICLSVCPTMYYATGSQECLPSSSTQQLISKKFNEHLSFNFASDFIPQTGSDYSSSSSLNPTLDRGFYSSSSKALISTDMYIFAPDLTLNLYFFPSGDGIVLLLEYTAGIYFIAPDLCIDLNVKRQSDQLQAVVTMCLPFNTEWVRVTFKITQIAGDSIQIGMFKDDALLDYAYFYNYEFRGSDGTDGQVRVGDPNLIWSFTGFIYTLNLYNSLSSDTLVASSIPSCTYFQYFVNGQCLDCDPICATFQCRFPDSCTTCYYTNCQTCTGYGIDDCTFCDNGETAPNCCESFCATCSSLLTCTSCQPGKVFIDSFCLYGTPFGITGSSLPIESVYSIIFDNNNFGLYTGWTSGSDSATYYHNGNGEADDPIPYKSRGLYFNGISTFMEYNSNIILAHKTTIVFLIKPKNIHPCQTLLKFDSVLKILNCGQVTLNTEDYLGASLNNAISYSSTNSNWHFLTVRISTVNFDTTVTVYQDSTSVVTSTFSSSAFRMPSCSMILGTGDGLYYYGFLYSIEIFQTDQNTISGYYVNCVNEVDSNCVNPCAINEYLVSNVCSACLSNCGEGCKDGLDCNFCVDSNCLQCKSFRSLSCSLCGSTFSLLGGVCYCPGGKVEKNNNCESCYTTCAGCSDIYMNSCSSCTVTSNYLLDGICVEICPTGYTPISTNCYNIFTMIANMKLDIDISYTTIDGFKSGSNISGFDDNDPYPTLTRGFYFRSNSYMDKTLIIPPTFTINIWIKVEADGIVLMNTVFNLQFRTGQTGFMFYTQGLNNYAVTDAIQYNTWMYLSVELGKSSTAQSIYSLYLNSNVIDSGTTADNNLIPIQSELLTIGNTVQSFQGFIWMIKIYNGGTSKNFDFSTSGCSTSCTYCDSDFTCPTDCNWETSINDCASSCPEACIYCYDSAYCDSCHPYTYRNGLDCNCYSNKWNVDTKECECRDCYITCEMCNSCKFQGCETCKSGYYLISTVCVYCPTGYIESEGSCTFNTSFVLDLKFDKISGVLFDSQSNFQAITGSSQQFYPNYEEDDPVAAFGRGFYFNGVSSVVRLPPNELDSQTIVFGAEFTFEIWFRTIGNTGTLFCKQELITFNSRNCLSISANSLYYDLYKSNGQYEEGATIFEGADFSIWSYFSVASYLSAFNYFEIEVQYNQDIIKFYAENILIDDSSGTTTIGAKIQSLSKLRRTNIDDFSDYFNGFIYQIRLYNIGIQHPLSSNSLCSSECFACDVENGACFSFCSIESVVPSCEPCGNCTNGCFDKFSNCELSGDSLCGSTSDYGVCAGCKDNAEFVDGICKCLESSIQIGFNCVICEEGYYFEAKSCVKCQENCKKCNNTDECLECDLGYNFKNSDCEKCPNGCSNCTETNCNQCESGFYLNDSSCEICEENCLMCNSTDCLTCSNFSDKIEGKCICKQEYKGIYCSLDTLLLKIYVNHDDSILLLFSNEVILSVNDMSVYHSNKIQEIKLNELNTSTFLVTVDFVKDVEKGDELRIEFKDSFKQKNQFKLESDSFSVNLYSKTVEISKTIEKLFESVYSSTAVYASIAAASFTSINPNPASLWNFISSVQLLTYLYMINIPYSKRTVGLLKGLRKYNMFPNLFDYIIITHGSDHEYTKAKDIGFTTNSILKNIGNIFSMLICFILLYYILKLLSKLFSFKKTETIKKYLEEMCSDYKYGFFIRFWIQSYIEFLATTFVAIRPANLNHLEDAYNFLAACFFMFINLLTLPVVFFFSKYYKPPTALQQNTTDSLYGSLFYEFKDDVGALRSHYYTMYFTRRMMYIIILFLLQDYPIIQICLSEILCLTMFFLLYFFKPFSEPILNYTNIGSELGMSFFILMASFYLFDLTENTQDNVDLCLVILLNSIVGLQMMGSILILIKTIRQKIRARKNKVEPEKIKFEVVLNHVDDDRFDEFHEIRGEALMNSPISSSMAKNKFEDSSFDLNDSKSQNGSK